MGSLSLRSLREDGIEPLALASYLAKIGTSDAIEPRPVAGRAGRRIRVRQDRPRAGAFRSGRTCSPSMPSCCTPCPMTRSRRASALGIGRAQAVLGGGEAQSHPPHRCRGALGAGDRPGDAGDRGCELSSPKPAALLPPEPWDEDDLGAWTKAVAAATGAKGRALFHPLRLALTGPEHGPELKKLLPLIGRAKALARLKGENGVTLQSPISGRHHPDFDLQLTLQKPFCSPTSTICQRFKRPNHR